MPHAAAASRALLTSRVQTRVQDVGVEWRQGSFELLGGAALRGLTTVDSAIFGVVRTFEGKGGSGAVFLGLIKERQPRIRPTVLEQTAIAALQQHTGAGDTIRINQRRETSFVK